MLAPGKSWQNLKFLNFPAWNVVGKRSHGLCVRSDCTIMKQMIQASTKKSCGNFFKLRQGFWKKSNTVILNFSSLLVLKFKQQSHTSQQQTYLQIDAVHSVKLEKKFRFNIMFFWKEHSFFPNQWSAAEKQIGKRFTWWMLQQKLTASLMHKTLLCSMQRVVDSKN